MNRVFLALLLTALLGAGCGSMRLIESDVSAHARFSAADAAVSGASYRFERLPSQENQPQARLEQIAEGALAKVGLMRTADAAQARFSVQINARSGTWLLDDEGRRFPTRGPYGSTHFSLGLGIGSSARFMGFNMHMTYLHRHEVSLLLRDLNSMQIVFETRAHQEGPWSDTAVLYGVMFDAALQGFPRPSAAATRVRTEIPR